MKRLDDVLGENSIFTRLSTHALPWAEDTAFSSVLLDFEYRNNFSGNKIVSPAVLKNLDPDTGKITTAAFNSLCDVAYMMYSKKWARYWADLVAEYDPIENYSMVENEETTYGKVNTASGTDSLLMTGTDTHANSGTDTETHSGGYTDKSTGGHSNTHSGGYSDTHSGGYSDTHSGGYSDTHTGGNTETHSGGYSDTGTTQATNVSAFNSSGLVPSSENTNIGKNQRTFNNEQIQTVYNTDQETRTYNADAETRLYSNDTVSRTYSSDAETFAYNNEQTQRTYNSDQVATQHGHTDTETLNRTDATTYGKKDTASGKDSRTLTRSGNIGTMTSQMMIESDITLWKWNFLYDVFKDIDTVFTISTY